MPVLAGLALATVVVGWQVAGTPWQVWPGWLQPYAVVCLVVALIAWPTATLARWLRRPQVGIGGRSIPVDLAPTLCGESPIGPGPGAWMLRLPGNESLRPRLAEWRVEVAGLPAALDGLTIAHLTDLHFRPLFDRRFYEALADAVARDEPDLVVCTGDLVEDERTIDWIVPVLSRARGRLGQFAILGNHDRYFDIRRIEQELDRAGFTVIDGSWRRLDVFDATLALGGTSAPWGPRLDPGAMPEADFRLLLSHTPDLFYRAASWGVDLLLAGHNHGGQVCLPVVGPVLMPSLYSRRFDQGFFRRGRTLMYVSRGVAAKHPIRYGCPSEVTRLELERFPIERSDSHNGRTIPRYRRA